MGRSLLIAGCLWLDRILSLAIARELDVIIAPTPLVIVGSLVRRSEVVKRVSDKET